MATSVPPVAQAPSTLPPPVTPSPKLTTRPAVSSHRSSARHKIPDQPVTLPLSFGSGIEKMGMQFGSLNLGDNTTETSQYVVRSCLCDEHTHNYAGLKLKSLPFQSQRLLQWYSQRSKLPLLCLRLLLRQRLLLRRH